MADEELVELLKTDVEAFNARSVVAADLKGADLSRADLSRANLREADLRGAKLRGAKLSGAKLRGADLSGADLMAANLNWADLSGAHLMAASLVAARLCEANLYGANLLWANLREANLRGANLRGANLIGAELNDAKCEGTVFANVDLRAAVGLIEVKHNGPSTIGTDTLARSEGQIPVEFLRGCGLSPWEILLVRCYDPRLQPAVWANDVSTGFMDIRFTGPMFARGVFISYSHADSNFVDKLYSQLSGNGCPCWLDRHDMVAGDMQQQIHRALRQQDVVVVVLSKDSIESDWVELEIETARGLEKERGSDVLCPVALDDAWLAKTDGEVLWRQLRKKAVIDFSSWKTKAFRTAFDKLYRGVLMNYEPTQGDGG